MNFNETRKSGTHTEEELNQLTLEEDMGELRRAQQILLLGHPIQKQAIYSNIRNLSKYSGFSQLLPLLSEDLVKQDEDIISIATTQFALIAKNMSERDKLTLLHQAFHFLKNYNLKLPEPWYEVFEMLYCYDMHNSIRLINELTDIDAESLLKQRGARLLQYIPSIEKIQLLCMDKDALVRLEIVQTIKIAYVHFTPDKFSAYLQMKISELIYDYDVQVRMAAIEMFFMVQSHLLDREKLIGKLFFEFLSSQNVQIITIMSRICGKVLLEILDLIPDLSKFIKIFKSFAQNPNDDLRINFAYNFPAIQAVLKEFDSLGPLYLSLMQHDPCPEVRETLMASVPDIITTIKNRTTLMPVVRKLLEHPIIQHNLYAIVYALWPSFDQQDQLSQSKILVNDVLVDLSRLLTTKCSSILLEQLLKDYMSSSNNATPIC